MKKPDKILTKYERKDLQKIRQKRARKYLQNSLLLSLIDTTQDEQMKKSYWNSWHCGNEVEATSIEATNNDGEIEHFSRYRHSEQEIKVNGKNKKIRFYCKSRFCLVCASLKSATLFSKYYEI